MMFSTLALFSDKRPKLTMILCVMMSVFVFVASEHLLERDKSTYQVTVVYCHSKPPKTITVRTRSIPNNSHILTYKLAAPVFGSEINVCDIQNVTLISE